MAGVDIWHLRGARINSAAIEALRNENDLRPREKRLLDYGWSPNGRIRIAVRIPFLTGSMVVGIPGPMRRFLDNHEFLGIAEQDGRRCGRIAINDSGSSYGYAKFIRQYGVDENDILIVEFDLITSNAFLSVSDDSAMNS